MCRRGAAVGQHFHRGVTNPMVWLASSDPPPLAHSKFVPFVTFSGVSLLMRPGAPERARALVGPAFFLGV